jgi:hypothetical protein
MRKEIESMDLVKSKSFDNLCISKITLEKNTITEKNVEIFLAKIISLIDLAKIYIVRLESEEISDQKKSEQLVDLLARLNLASDKLILDPEISTPIITEKDTREAEFQKIKIEVSHIKDSILASKKLIGESARVSTTVANSLPTVVDLLNIIKSEAIEINTLDVTGKRKLGKMIDVLGRLNLLSQNLIEKPVLDEASYTSESAPILTK